jgi:queuine tRNA-ribosyltransferase
MAAKEPVGCHLLTIHNIHFQLDLMRRARHSIEKGCFPEFVREFLRDWYHGAESLLCENNGLGFENVHEHVISLEPKSITSIGDSSNRYPQWVIDALQSVGINMCE